MTRGTAGEQKRGNKFVLKAKKRLSWSSDKRHMVYHNTITIRHFRGCFELVLETFYGLARVTSLPVNYRNRYIFRNAFQILFRVSLFFSPSHFFMFHFEVMILFLLTFITLEISKLSSLKRRLAHYSKRSLRRQWNKRQNYGKKFSS